MTENSISEKDSDLSVPGDTIHLDDAFGCKIPSSTEGTLSLHGLNQPRV